MTQIIAISGRSDIGQIRRRNEDAFAVIDDLGVAVVADGMGGHPGGDVASRIAADTAARVLGDAVEAHAESIDFVDHFREVMEGAVLQAHRAVREHGVAEPRLEGMGTTLTAMVVHRPSGAWVIGHVGDSRVYRFRAGDLVQLTRDDTWVQEQIDRGEMPPESARLSPYAHLLTQCVGLEDDPVPQVLDGNGDPDDVYLLCTDGLVGMLDDEKVAAILANGATSRGDSDSLQELLDAANEAGGHDNVTAALVRYD